MYDTALILQLVKSRLNRLATDTSLDGYLVATIEAAAGYLAGQGIRLNGSARDNMLLCNQAVQMYQNRDQSGADPDWLRAQRRQRWLEERVIVDDP